MIRIFFNSPIFITFVVRTFYVAKYRTVKNRPRVFLIIFMIQQNPICRNSIRTNVVAEILSLLVVM